MIRRRNDLLDKLPALVEEPLGAEGVAVAAPELRLVVDLAQVGDDDGVGGDGEPGHRHGLAGPVLHAQRHVARVPVHLVNKGQGQGGQGLVLRS